MAWLRFAYHPGVTIAMAVGFAFSDALALFARARLRGRHGKGGRYETPAHALQQAVSASSPSGHMNSLLFPMCKTQPHTSH